MKPLMIPTLSHQRISPSGRSGSQSEITNRIIRTAQDVYKEEPWFQKAISPSRIAIQNGNDPDRISQDPALMGTLHTNQTVLELIRRERLAQDVEELKRKHKLGAVPIVGNSLSVNPLFSLMEQRTKDTGVANCGELAYYFQRLLDTVGLPTLQIHVQIQGDAKKKRVCSDHCFLVAGLDSKASLSLPNTYGNHAVYLDAWWEGGLFVPIKEGLEKLKGAFPLEAREYLKFKPIDYYCDYNNNNHNNNFKFPTFATVEQLLPKFKNP